MKNRGPLSINWGKFDKRWAFFSFHSLSRSICYISVEINLGLLGLSFSLCSPCYIKQCAPPLIITDSSLLAEQSFNSLCKHSVCPCFDFEIGLQDKTLQSSDFQSSILGVSIFPKTKLRVHRLRFKEKSPNSIAGTMDLYFLQKSHFQTKWTWLYCTRSLWRGALLDIRWLLIFCRCHMTLCVCVCVAYDMIYMIKWRWILQWWVVS